MKVAVYTIAKNEEQHVARWLNTTKDADVRLLVDTGSTDQTPHRFHQEGKKGDGLLYISVEPFRFDDARNAALALVPADVDVCISLDMDEVLSDGWRNELIWSAKEWEGNRCVQANITFDYHGRKFVQNTRVHSRHGWRWRHPYHEALYPSMSQRHEVNLPNFVMTHAPIGEKKRPNIALHNLAWGEFEQPCDARMMFYYGRELLWSGYKEQGLRKLLAFVQQYPNAIDVPEARALLAKSVDTA